MPSTVHSRVVNNYCAFMHIFMYVGPMYQLHTHTHTPNNYVFIAKCMSAIILNEGVVLTKLYRGTYYGCNYTLAIIAYVRSRNRLRHAIHQIIRTLVSHNCDRVIMLFNIDDDVSICGAGDLRFKSIRETG